MNKEQKSYIISILILTYLLVIAGVVMNFSISPTSNNAFSLTLFYRYVISVGVGSLVLIFFSFFNYNLLKKLAFPMLLVLFILLFITKSSPDTHSNRWIFTGLPFAFQPSQYVTLSLSIFTAKLLSIKIHKEEFSKYCVFILLVAIGFAGIVAKEPDLGTASIIFITMIILLYAIGMNLKLLSGFIALITLAGFVFVRHNTNWHGRIVAFLHPEKFASGKGYQALQSFRAIAHGGIYGVGLTRSFFKYGGLPENGADFIFAITGEELGLIGEMIVIVLFFMLSYIGFRISRAVNNDYARILALGITLNILIGTVINISANIGLLPVTGVPLPIISYSGNNILATFAGIGILINIVRKEMK